jgi:lipoate-protein ligase A
MAIDEALLESAPLLGRPVLRFYEWSQPTASFGYFQRYDDVAAMTRLRPLIRRPTGGGLVPHDRDWTYSLVFPPSAPWYALPAIESYEYAHRWVQSAFARIGVGTVLSAEPIRVAQGQCFVGAEKFDVLWSGQKIGGAAQRRSRSGLLIQGSIQPPVNTARSDWENAFCQCSPSGEQVAWEPFCLDRLPADRIQLLIQGKYSLDSYNRKK